MNDALAVCLIEGIGDLRAVAQDLLERQRTFDQAVGQ